MVLPLHLHNKRRIAQQFSRAAEHYDMMADIQFEIAFDASQMLPAACGPLLDIGCGTGRISQQLLSRSQHVFALDLALGMLQHAQRKIDRIHHITWMQGDAEQLPLKNASMSAVFSSMVLQWCDNPHHIMQEVNRVLMPKGEAVLAIMCQGSFRELSHSWMQLDKYRHVNQFKSAQLWKKAAIDQGLTLNFTEKRYQTFHSNIRALLATIKKVGANVLLRENESSMDVDTKPSQLNRASLDRLQHIYFAQFAEKQQLPLSYNIAFLHCIKS